MEGAINEPALSVETVARDRMVAVVAPGHSWAGGKPLGRAELLAAQWIMREDGSGTRAAFESALAEYDISISLLQIALALPSNEAVRSAVMAGPFATVISELVVASHLQVGLLASANFQLTARGFHMLRHTERYKTKASMAFEQLIRGSPGLP